MGLLNDLNATEEKNVEYFINNKVDHLIEKAAVEGKKRQKIQEKVAKDCADMNTNDGIEYLNSIADFSDFPRYTGRGIQDNAPDISSDTLTMWFSEVEKEDVEFYIAQVSNAGFEKKGQDYVKEIGGKEFVMSISHSGDRLRLFYKHG